ncbi:hypothetical protein [Psychrobacillus antarcticus]|uniref:hypothetical protein n=1 Tax=Psychrobacillus antarcticus TaxID=2879115 RepID=UPI002408805F|nr:hypothetical protein [Psychrobacillus antarcticus]
MTKLEIILNDFYFETLIDIVKQFNELVPEHSPYSYSAQDVIELLLLREHVNSEIKITRP